MRDKLKEFIEDYNSGAISIIDLERRLNFDDWKFNKYSSREKLCGSITEDVISQINSYSGYMTLPKDPADIVEQKEISIGRYRAIVKLKSLLNKTDWETLIMVVKGKKQQEIADIQGITQSAVCKHLKRIATVAEKIGLRELLDDVQVHHNPTKSGNEFSSAVDVAMAHREGRKRVCMVPEYLKETNCESVCVICNKCTAKDRNKVYMIPEKQ